MTANVMIAIRLCTLYSWHYLLSPHLCTGFDVHSNCLAGGSSTTLEHRYTAAYLNKLVFPFCQIACIPFLLVHTEWLLIGN